MSKAKFYKAWDYLKNCNYFKIDEFGENYFGLGSFNISVENKSISVKTGCWYNEYNCWSHDFLLDCGGDTFEDAIIELARLVKKYYN